MSGSALPLSVPKGTIYRGQANFAGLVQVPLRLSGYTFPQHMNFSGVKFQQAVDFRETTFEQGADFKDATFEHEAIFNQAHFKGEAHFDRTTFKHIADFERANFDKMARFWGATFNEWANFRCATFSHVAVFVNAKTKSMTSFDDASFRHQPPFFDGAELHEGTTWFGVTWPPIPNTRDDARETVRAYERLKLEMDRLKKHEDELNFFALELQARRVLAGKWSSLTGWAIWAYGGLSDYGRSVPCPLFLLLVTALAGADALSGYGGLGYGRALGLSAANTLGVFNFRQAFFAADEIAKLPGWLQVVSAVETIFGALLLFLVGLGLRNAFRLR